MPRTIKDILDHADELAKRFEDYEPSATDERDPAVFAELRRAVLSRSDAERSIRDAVKHARDTVAPGRSSARWSEPPAKQPVSATAISKTHRPSGFGSVRDHSKATHSCRIASSLWSVDRSSADADDLKEVFESNKI
jgi:hypothetical protein